MPADLWQTLTSNTSSTRPKHNSHRNWRKRETSQSFFRTQLRERPAQQLASFLNKNRAALWSTSSVTISSYWLAKYTSYRQIQPCGCSVRGCTGI